MNNLIEFKKSLIINDNYQIPVTKKAKFTLTIFEDYECEYCGKAFEQLKAVRNYFKENICVIYKQFPRTSIHPSALLAALVAEAGRLQNRFMEVHDTIFEFQSYLEYGLGAILGIMEKKYAISIEQIMEDIKKPFLLSKINNDVKYGVQMGVKNTPAIFINNNIYNGAVKFNELSTTICQQILNKKF